MREITTPFPITEIIVTPEPSGRLRLSDDIPQTLSSLFGYDGESRRPLRCGKTGTLFCASAPIQTIQVVTADEINYVWTGSNIETTEVLIRARSTNADTVLVAVDAAAGAANSWILLAGESLQFTVNNLQRLNLKITADGEIADLLYTR